MSHQPLLVTSSELPEPLTSDEEADGPYPPPTPCSSSKAPAVAGLWSLPHRLRRCCTVKPKGMMLVGAPAFLWKIPETRKTFQSKKTNLNVNKGNKAKNDDRQNSSRPSPGEPPANPIQVSFLGSSILAPWRGHLGQHPCHPDNLTDSGCRDHHCISHTGIRDRWPFK